MVIEDMRLVSVRLLDCIVVEGAQRSVGVGVAGIPVASHRRTLDKQ